MWNPFELRVVRGAIYTLTVFLAAAMAGYTAIGDIPEWLIFLSAASTVLSGATSLSHLSPDEGGGEDG